MFRPCFQRFSPLAAAAAVFTLSSAAPTFGGFSYAPMDASEIVSATFYADFAELSAEREIFGTTVNMAMLIDPREGGLGMYDLTDDLFGPVNGPPKIALAPTKTGVFEVDIDDSFWPALATGNIGLWALFTDTDDGWFGIDYLSLVIETKRDTIETFFQGMTNDGFKINPAPADGADLSAPLRTLRPFGSTGTGFDEAVSSKAIHVIPAPGAGMILAIGGCVMLRRRRKTGGRRALLLATTVVTAAAATTVVAHQGHNPATLEQMTRRAAVIAEGEILSVDSSWDASNTRIFSTIRMRVSQYHKGGEQPEILEFTQLGGSVDDTTLAIVGAARFTPGEIALVLLRPDWQQYDHPVVEMEHGKYSIEIADNGDLYYINSEGIAEQDVEFLGRLRRVNATLDAVPVDPEQP